MSGSKYIDRLNEDHFLKQQRETSLTFAEFAQFRFVKFYLLTTNEIPEYFDISLH